MSSIISLEDAKTISEDVATIFRDCFYDLYSKSISGEFIQISLMIPKIDQIGFSSKLRLSYDSKIKHIIQEKIGLLCDQVRNKIVGLKYVNKPVNMLVADFYHSEHIDGNNTPLTEISDQEFFKHIELEIRRNWIAKIGLRDVILLTNLIVSNHDVITSFIRSFFHKHDPDYIKQLCNESIDKIIEIILKYWNYMD